MLVLSRDENEAIVVGGNIRIVVLEAHKGRVRLGIEAPKHISVNREEVQILVDAEKRENG